MTDPKIDAAIRTLQSHVASNNTDYEALHDLSVLMGQAGHLADALHHAEQVTELAPTFAEGWLNLGNLQSLSGDKNEAIASLERACGCAPDDPRTWFNLGNLLAQADHLQDSIDALQKANALAPKEPSILASLALAYRRHNQISDAIKTYEAALALQPNNTWVHSNLLVSRQYNLGETDQSLFEAHRAWGQQHGTSQQLSKRAPRSKPRRIGYVSGDFRKHPVGYFLMGFLSHHTRDDFEVVCISDTRSTDDMTADLIANSDEWIETADLGHDAFCARVLAADIDILVDLSGHFRHSRLPEFTHKLAPVQATWAGYVGTTGVSAMDWLIADHHQAPDGYADYATERVMRLPQNYVCYTPPAVLPDVAPLPAQHQGAVTFGCFNNFAKVNDAVLQTWADILTATPGSRLFLKAATLSQAEVHADVIALLGESGVAESRITLEGASTHSALLGAYNRVDIALDPFPYSGGLTTLEALLMGVPVVTQTGATFAGRHSTSHLSAVGLEDWITTDNQSYVDLAIAKAQEIDELSKLRHKLRHKFLASPICDAAGFTRTLERAYREMWTQSVVSGDSNDAPRTLDIT